MAGKNLVIVESPGKVKTIQKYLGKEYLVKASIGHIRDLEEHQLSVDVAHGFRPQYVVPADKKKVVAELEKLALDADTVWLASDEDREGEAISWHLRETLQLPPAKTRRIVFHEITKTAILEAIEHPRDIDMDLVDAQQARRVLDRLVGFELSPILWRKIQPKLSAGRVQSVALRLIVDREKEIMAFNPEPYYKVEAVFRPEGESTILPSTWHDTGLSLWGEAGKWRYEALVVAGLDAFMYDRDNFIKHGAGSPYEYKVANKLGFAARIDNFSVKDLRLSLSGFYGQGMHNSYPNDMWNTRYADVKGHTAVGAFDFAYTGRYLTVRGNADYGYVSDAQVISTVKRNLSSNDAPYKKTPVGSAACAFGLEAGYDFLHLFARGGQTEQQLYLFGRYEYYDSYIPAADQPDYPYTDRHRMAVGINWLPIPQVALKCEYSRRFLKSQYNDEPSLSLGLVYMGFFHR